MVPLPIPVTLRLFRRNHTRNEDLRLVLHQREPPKLQIRINKTSLISLLLYFCMNFSQTQFVMGEIQP